MLRSLQRALDLVRLSTRRVAWSGEEGQAITEYVALVAIFVGVTFVMVVLLDVFAKYGWRILSLVGMNYP